MQFFIKMRNRPSATFSLSWNDETSFRAIYTIKREFYFFNVDFFQICLRSGNI